MILVYTHVHASAHTHDFYTYMEITVLAQYFTGPIAKLPYSPWLKQYVWFWPTDLF